MHGFNKAAQQQEMSFLKQNPTLISKVRSRLEYKVSVLHIITLL